MLDKIKFGIEEDELNKKSLFFNLASLAPIVCEHESLCQNLYWIVPKSLGRLRETSDSDEIFNIYKTLNNIFEFFIGVEDSDLYPHLLEIKDDIEEAAVRLFSDFIKKGDTFKINDKHLGIILSLGSYVLDKCWEKFEDEFKGSCDNLSAFNIQMLISHMFRLRKDQTEELVEKWMDKTVWKKIKSPRSSDEFKLGITLKIFGIDEIEYGLRSDNENILIKYIAIVSAISRHAIDCSKSTLTNTIKFFALCFENPQNRISANSIAAMNLYFNNLAFSISGIPGKAAVKETVKSGSSKIPNVDFKFPHAEKPEKVELMFKGWVLGLFETCESLMKQILSADSLEETNYSKERVVEIYSHSVKQEGEEATAESIILNPLVDSFSKVMSLLTGFLQNDYTTYQLLNSPNFISFCKSFKKKVFYFLLKSKLFELDKIKRNIYGLFSVDVETLNIFINGSKKLDTFFYKNLSYNSSTHFKLLPIRS